MLSTVGDWPQTLSWATEAPKESKSIKRRIYSPLNVKCVLKDARGRRAPSRREADLDSPTPAFSDAPIYRTETKGQRPPRTQTHSTLQILLDQAFDTYRKHTRWYMCEKQGKALKAKRRVSQKERDRQRESVPVCACKGGVLKMDAL